MKRLVTFTFTGCCFFYISEQDSFHLQNTGYSCSARHFFLPNYSILVVNKKFVSDNNFSYCSSTLLGTFIGNFYLFANKKFVKLVNCGCDCSSLCNINIKKDLNKTEAAKGTKTTTLCHCQMAETRCYYNQNAKLKYCIIITINNNNKIRKKIYLNYT